ncbi:hypothetical protein BpHYR1_036147 [Brachionus plicatilis]|uniref:Uncharacterized protein n=1 Tax=Brachionus plicatilis TaxID=10195 RepID=A0A3M7PEK0_BRAPC|nr:hypothetical protein BpHYR1_036147 [Brachionus plicatilis]
MSIYSDKKRGFLKVHSLNDTSAYTTIFLIFILYKLLKTSYPIFFCNLQKIGRLIKLKQKRIFQAFFVLRTPYFKKTNALNLKHQFTNSQILKKHHLEKNYINPLTLISMISIIEIDRTTSDKPTRILKPMIVIGQMIFERVVDHIVDVDTEPCLRLRCVGKLYEATFIELKANLTPGSSSNPLSTNLSLNAAVLFISYSSIDLVTLRIANKSRAYKLCSPVDRRLAFSKAVKSESSSASDLVQIVFSSSTSLKA